MFALTMVAIHTPLAEMPDAVIYDRTEYDNESQAELRALRWLSYAPDDIVMLHDDSEVYCINCGRAIEYVDENALHKWKHRGHGILLPYFVCMPSGLTQAEPAGKRRSDAP